MSKICDSSGWREQPSISKLKSLTLWICILINLTLSTQQELSFGNIKNYYNPTDFEDPASDGNFPVFETEERSFRILIISNIDPSSDRAKTYTNAILSLIEPPQAFDLVIDIGSAYINSNDSESVNSYLEVIQPLEVASTPFLTYLRSSQDALDFQNRTTFQSLIPYVKYITNAGSEIKLILLEGSRVLHSPEAQEDELAQLGDIWWDIEQGDQAEDNWNWNVVMVDMPLWCSSEWGVCDDQAREMREVYEDAFYKNKVDLVLSGGFEFYERTFPKYQRKSPENMNSSLYSSPNMPVYINENGCFKVSIRDQQSLDQRPWLAFSSLGRGEKEMSYGVLTVVNGTHLKYEHWTIAGKLVDEFFISKVSHKAKHWWLYLAYSILAIILAAVFTVVIREARRQSDVPLTISNMIKTARTDLEETFESSSDFHTSQESKSDEEEEHSEESFDMQSSKRQKKGVEEVKEEIELQEIS